MALRELYSLAEQYSTGFLSKGREGWDIPHTRAVFYYAKILTKAAEQDMAVIPTAAWLHDIGYFGLFSGDSGDYATVLDKKARHMTVGAKMAEIFVNREDVKKLMFPDQRNRVIHLVEVHDRLEELTDVDERILAEADTLGAIDTSRVTPTFSPSDRAKYSAIELHGRREAVFITDLGKEIFSELRTRFENYKD